MPGKFVILLTCILALTGGCTYYQTAPGVYSTTLVSKFDRSWTAAVGALATEATLASPYTLLKKPVSVTVESRYDFGFLLRLVIKAYVIDIRLERMLASDITERFIEALRDQGHNMAHRDSGQPPAPATA